MNTLRELISEIYLEASQFVSDDTALDDRLIIQFINKQRSLWIRNELNKSRTVDANILQNVTSSIELCNNIETLNVPVGYKLYKTTIPIPSFIELHYRSAIEQVIPLYSQDKFSQSKVRPFKIIDYTSSMYVGHGKFTRGLVFAYYLNDRIYVLIPEKGFFNEFEGIVITGIFENPNLVPGFNIESSRYPLSSFMWNYIKGTIIQQDLRNFYVNIQDPSNNSSNDLTRNSSSKLPNH